MYKPLYIAAPMIAVICALTSIAVIPIGNAMHIYGHDIPLQITDVNIGLLIILGITQCRRVRRGAGGLVVEQQVFPARRTARQCADGQLRDLSGPFARRRADSVWQFQSAEIVEAQSWIMVPAFIPKWNIFYGGQFVAFFIYLMSAYAETNRIPFDLPEAETELVAGYHTEYSAMKFAMFFMAEYANMITVACRGVAAVPGRMARTGFWASAFAGVSAGRSGLCLKVVAFLFIYIWVRGTLPRFRYDQLMAFGWKFLLPLAIANLVITALVVALRELRFSSSSRLWIFSLMTHLIYF